MIQGKELMKGDKVKHRISQERMIIIETDCPVMGWGTPPSENVRCRMYDPEFSDGKGYKTQLFHKSELEVTND